MEDDNDIKFKEREFIKVVIFCPVDIVDNIMTAMSNAGAGRMGLYRRCFWVTQGYGTYIDFSQSIEGKINEVCNNPETRIECVCKKDYWNNVNKAIRQAFPNHKISIDLYPLLNVMI